MSAADLNLIIALDALLAEGSVTGAAKRLGLSASAMSRTLTRLRSATGDPLLVRAGRGLAPTPRADDLRHHVHEIAREAQSILRPHTDGVDLTELELIFTVRVSEGFLEFLSVPVLTAIATAAPNVRLQFAPKPDKDPRPLREGTIDLEVGVLGTSAPEIRTQVLFHDDYVGLARTGHRLLANDDVTPQRFAACKHVAASREGDVAEQLDQALQGLGLRRCVTVVVPGYPDAMRIARQSDLVAVAPRSCLGTGLGSDQSIGPGLEHFELPFSLPGFTISAMWHPRVDADPAHRALREIVMSVCRRAYPKRS